MGLADRLSRIILIQHACTDSSYIRKVPYIAGYLRLSASVDASARASHDLDELVVCLAGFYFVKKRSRIAKSGCHCHLYIHARNIVCSLFYALGATDIREIQVRQFFARQHFHCGTKGCFHNSAGSAKDYGRSCGLAHRIIELLIRKDCKVDATAPDQSCQFSGRNGNIHIRHSRGILVIPANLELLGSTWHDADRYDLLRIDAFLLSKISLQHRAEHLLRRLAGRQILCHIREIMLAILNPSRRTGRDHRKHAAILNSV